MCIQLFGYYTLNDLRNKAETRYRSMKDYQEHLLVDLASYVEELQQQF